MALAYRYTHEPECIELFYDITDYFIQRLPADRIPYWDLTFIDGDEPRDSSAAAVAACGILEMLPFLPEEKAAYYRKIALELADALVQHCAVSDLGAITSIWNC